MDWIDELFEEGQEKAPLTESQIYSLYGLLDQSTISHERKESIDMLIHDQMTFTEWIAIKVLLQDNQPDPITSGKNYSQTDIKNHLAKITGDD